MIAQAACSLLVLFMHTAAQPDPIQTTPIPLHADSPNQEWDEVFPGVRINRSLPAVEFDGIVPINAHDPHAPDVYLEAIVCAPDSKEHESLVMTRAKPSHIHAALLLLGFDRGHPGKIEWNGTTSTTVSPTGSPIDVRIRTTNPDGSITDSRATSWIVSNAGNPYPQENARWVFAGSYMHDVQGTETYMADREGVIVGLHTFGAETIALQSVLSPDAGHAEPEWIASADLVPAQGTHVTVRLVSWPVASD